MKKKWFLIFFTSVTFLASSSLKPVSAVPTNLDDFDTEAVVIDAVTSPRSESGFMKGRNGKQYFSYLPFLSDTYLLPTSENENEVSASVVTSPSSNIDKSCLTNQGKNGNCEPFETCFPLLNLPEGKFGNETTNYSNLQDELYQISKEPKCSSVVHAGNSKFANVCCDVLHEPDVKQPTPTFYNSPTEEEDEAGSYTATSPRYTKVVNTWATCGEKQFDFKIIGGQETIPHEFPWMVSLWGKSGRHICGAALLDNNFVITAAHCIARYTAEDVGKIRLLVGDHNIQSTEDGHHEVRSVSRIIKHKRFSLQTFTNDIALLKFDRPVPYTDRIRPICLPSGLRSTNDDPQLLVAGWGQTTYKGTSSNVLRKVLVPGVNNESCGHHYNTISPVGITSEMLCAGGSGVDSCIGDSGGPLIQLVGNRYEQVGIVSFGRECGTYPGVYTKVHSYLNWIAVNRKKY